MFKNNSEIKKTANKPDDYSYELYNRPNSNSRFNNRKRNKKKNEYNNEMKESKWQ